MSRILVYTTPARGHLFPVTPIMDELHRRGHDIALRTLGSQVPMMRERGFDAAPIDPRIEDRNERCGRSANAPGSTRWTSRPQSRSSTRMRC